MNSKSYSLPVLLFCLMSLFSFSEVKDSLKDKYALNDLRNSNCPCHKYQEKAEKEFQKIIEKEMMARAPVNYQEKGKGSIRERSFLFRNKFKKMNRHFEKKGIRSKKRKRSKARISRFDACYHL